MDSDLNYKSFYSFNVSVSERDSENFRLELVLTASEINIYQNAGKNTIQRNDFF